MQKICEGPKDAKIAIIGEAPGRNEELQGRPFVGSSGKILDQILHDVGIRREDVWLDNVCYKRPPGNDFSKLSASDAAEGSERLRNTLSSMNLNVIVPVGNHALYATAGETGITKWRGSILSGTCGKTIPTFHPSYIMRQWKHRPLAVLDFERIKSESTTPDISLPEPTFIIDPPFERSMQLLDDCLQAEYLSFDIETDIATGSPICIGFSTAIHSAFCIPFRKQGVPCWSLVEESALWRKIDQVLNSDGPKKIAQNVMFDAHVLHSVLGIQVSNFWMDTMLVHNIIYSELPKGLDTLCSIYTRYPFYKDMEKSDRSLWRYNCLDACVTLEVALALHKEAQEFEVWDYYCRWVQPLIWPLLEAQSRGCRIDSQKMKAHAESLKSVLEKCNSVLTEACGKTVNINSPKQLRELLYDDLGLPVQYSKHSSTPTTNNEALEALSDRYPDNPVLRIIMEHRKASKLYGTYMTAPLGKDDRMRCSYNIAGTETGRISSSRSVTGEGSNLQNVPKGPAREIYIPDEGMRFMNVDLSQAEARIVAYLANEPSLIEIFESKGDVHERIAMLVFNDKDMRPIAKRLVHAYNYGIGYRTFAAVAKVSWTSAKEFLSRISMTFPMVAVWHKMVEAELKRTRILCDLCGRKRMFFDRWGQQLFREGYSYIPQSTVGNLLNRALTNLYEVGDENIHILLHTHDGFVLQFPESYEERTRELVTNAFNIPLYVNNYTVRIPISIDVGANWNEV